MGTDDPGPGSLMLSATHGGVGSLGARLRGFRVRAGLSQEALAERAGLGVATLRALERGRRQQPHPHTLARLMEALGLAAPDRAGLLAVATRATAPLSGPGASPAAPADLVRLPAPPTPLIGREAEVAAIRTLLEPTTTAARLVTLVGPGGVGKTRLALAVAATLRDAYPDGVVFVDLAPLRDPRLVAVTAAHALGLREAGGRSAGEVLVDNLREWQGLLVLDNFEHLLGAAPGLAELLEACARVAVLVTSRAALRLRAERRVAVGPLATPPNGRASFDDIAVSPAVRLFIERAQAVAPDFVFHPSHAAAVAAICHRLDGLPLAIELAAAWAGLLQPAALLRRLEHRLPLLTAGGADVPKRQQTLQNTLTWSHDLLDPPEQVLFRRLAVFAGGFTLEAAETVCADATLAADGVLAGLQVLADHSLLVRQGAAHPCEPRLGLLETVREYAREQLERAGELAASSQQHAEYCLALVRGTEPQMYGDAQVEALDRLEVEHPNLRAALTWAVRTEAVDLALELASGLRFFWYVRGYQREGSDWLLALLRHPGAAAPTQTRARALNAAACLLSAQGRQAEARTLLEEAEAIGRATGDADSLAFTHRYLGIVANAERDGRRARTYLDQSLAHYRQTGTEPELSLTLMHLADALLLVDHGEAERRYAESAVRLEALGNRNILPYPLRGLAYLALRRGDAGRAARLCLQGLQLNQCVGERQGMAASLVGLAAVASTQHHPDLAARLLGAADALLAPLGSQLLAVDQAHAAHTTAALRRHLGDPAFAAARAVGQAMPVEVAALEAATVLCVHPSDTPVQPPQ